MMLCIKLAPTSSGLADTILGLVDNTLGLLGRKSGLAKGFLFDSWFGRQFALSRPLGLEDSNK